MWDWLSPFPGCTQVAAQLAAFSPWLLADAVPSPSAGIWATTILVWFAQAAEKIADS